MADVFCKKCYFGNETFTVKGVEFTMIAVEGGTFTMGATPEQGSDAEDWEKPTHQVTLSSYYIGETEVTQALWQAVMGKTVSQIASEISRETYGVGDNYPMYYISWNDCQKFIKKLNSLTGKNFRLPTEAEWEYAARGGNKSRGYKYSGSDNVDNVAWYKENSDDKTHPVKSKQANELGIYDMSGNVQEWCQDWYGFYDRIVQTNPIGPVMGEFRVIRGGNWEENVEVNCQTWSRGCLVPSDRRNYLGFRLVLSAE